MKQTTALLHSWLPDLLEMSYDGIFLPKIHHAFQEFWVTKEEVLKGRCPHEETGSDLSKIMQALRTSLQKNPKCEVALQGKKKQQRKEKG